MEKILNKIKNLLDLANNNPNENEAIAAALKAQELMAKYDIEMDQVADVEKPSHEIAEAIFWENANSHHVKAWKRQLAKIIADNFRCKHYYLGRSDVVFYGYKEDAHIALQVFTYLYTMGNKFANRRYNQCRKESLPTQGVLNTYLMGFCAGVEEVLAKQCRALMIVTPQEVNDKWENRRQGMKTLKVSAPRTRGRDESYAMGKADGRDIAKARALETAV